MLLFFFSKFCSHLKSQCFISVNVRFFSLFGAKHNHTSPTSSESAKELVRISVLAEKLDLWWKLQIAV